MAFAGPTVLMAAARRRVSLARALWVPDISPPPAVIACGHAPLTVNYAHPYTIQMDAIRMVM
ncbi:hypothetical protein ABIE73_001202 [Bradyrhizobium yuanmingense]